MTHGTCNYLFKHLNYMQHTCTSPVVWDYRFYRSKFISGESSIRSRLSSHSKHVGVLLIYHRLCQVLTCGPGKELHISCNISWKITFSLLHCYQHNHLYLFEFTNELTNWSFYLDSKCHKLKVWLKWQSTNLSFNILNVRISCLHLLVRRGHRLNTLLLLTKCSEYLVYNEWPQLCNICQWSDSSFGLRDAKSE